MEVPAGGSVRITATLTLTAAAKAQMDEQMPNGGYVEAFVYANEIASEQGAEGVSHSIPVLAFYGNWSDASMFDKGSFVENVLLEMERPPYLYQAVGDYNNFLTVIYENGGEYYYGGNPVTPDPEYLPERNALNSNKSVLGRIFYSLIRNSDDTSVVISNAQTGEVYAQYHYGEQYPAYFNAMSGMWEAAQQFGKLNWAGTDGAGNPLPEGTQLQVSLTAIPSYYRDGEGGYDMAALGKGVSFTTPVVIDNTAPEVQDIRLSVMDGKVLQVVAQDNQYVAGVQVCNAAGNTVLAVGRPDRPRWARRR